jgi:hypothetical protein
MITISEKHSGEKEEGIQLEQISFRMKVGIQNTLKESENIL